MQILSANYLLTMTGDPIIDGAVAVEGGEIIDVGTEEALLNRYHEAAHEDYPNHVIMPGLINSHVHLDMSFYKDFHFDPVRTDGLVVNFIEWLMGNIHYKKTALPNEKRQAIEWAIDECFQSGTTCVADMSSYEGIFTILEQKNMRAVVFPEVLSIDNEMTKELFESAMAIIEKYADYDSDLVSVGAGPFSPYMLSRNLLKIMAQVSSSSEVPIMIHAAESFSEMEFFHNSSGDIASKLFPNIGWDELPPEHQKTPIQHLSFIGFLEASPILVGCAQVTDTDLDHIAKSGSKVVITSRSHENLQQGIAPYRRLKERSIITALGTDGIPSVENLSLWDEMRAFVQHHSDANALTGHEVLSMVTIAAAQALGLQDEIGSIEKGKKADLILIDLTSVPTEGDLAMNLIKNVNNYAIKSVMVSGKNVKSMS
ncbi:MAG: amidohydrolase family protein [bacterium]|nr:amidohydrolase family protein [bacterium]MBU1917816.1 amidohydrolase family protein [bacterium]